MASRSCKLLCYVLGLLAKLVMACGGFVYFHHYQSYENAYYTCKSHNMRLVRVDSETKHQEVMDFTRGVENFTVGSAAFKISLRYDVAGATFLWPDGSVYTMTNKWMTSEPNSPNTQQCVVQYSGQSRFFGQWRTKDCDNGSPYICETGYGEDPAITVTNSNDLEYGTFVKINSTLLNTYNQSQAEKTTFFRFEDNDMIIYRGYKDDDISQCALACMTDRVCTGIIYTHNNSPHASGDMCIFVREKEP